MVYYINESNDTTSLDSIFNEFNLSIMEASNLLNNYFINEANVKENIKRIASNIWRSIKKAFDTVKDKIKNAIDTIRGKNKKSKKAEEASKKAENTMTSYYNKFDEVEKKAQDTINRIVKNHNDVDEAMDRMNKACDYIIQTAEEIGKDFNKDIERFKNMGVNVPFHSHEEFNDIMSDPNGKLVFE